MKIRKIQIQNFRLLKNFTIDLENELSLIVGKNNTGKTSVLTLLDKFLHWQDNKITFDDFNVEFQKELKTIIEATDSKEYKSVGIKLQVYIECEESDDIGEISKLFMELRACLNFVQ